VDELVDIADAVGLPARQLPEAIEGQAIKQALRAATDRALARGVVDVPCIKVDEKLFYGDDQLELAKERVDARDAT
jgi:2-hydroxychromene-2-carboxylate isomerase